MRIMLSIIFVMKWVCWYGRISCLPVVFTQLIKDSQKILRGSLSKILTDYSIIPVLRYGVEITKTNGGGLRISRGLLRRCLIIRFTMRLFQKY